MKENAKVIINGEEVSVATLIFLAGKEKVFEQIVKEAEKYDDKSLK